MARRLFGERRTPEGMGSQHRPERAVSVVTKKSEVMGSARQASGMDPYPVVAAE